MRVLVSDTSVLIDLDRGDLLEEIFALPFDFAVPDLLYRQEIEPEWNDRLIKLGLRVEELSGDGVSAALEWRKQHRNLSVPDSFALSLALERQWTLLTGDSILRKLAAGERLECHGVLWTLDQFEERGWEAARLLNALEAMMRHPRCRLPKREVSLRLQRYSSRT